MAGRNGSATHLDGPPVTAADADAVVIDSNCFSGSGGVVGANVEPDIGTGEREPGDADCALRRDVHARSRTRDNRGA